MKQKVDIVVSPCVLTSGEMETGELRGILASQSSLIDKL